MSVIDPGIIPIANTGKNRLETLINQADVVYKHLDWSPPSIWLDNPGFLALAENGTFTACMACPVQPARYTWIRYFACMYSSRVDGYFSRLLVEVIKVCAAQGISSIYAIPITPEYEHKLQSNQFQVSGQIITLQLDFPSSSSSQLSNTTRVDNYMPDDFSALLNLDMLAFNPPWQLISSDLNDAIDSSNYRKVFRADTGEAVAYLLVYHTHYSAHLSRIAVHPQYRQKGIATGLIKAAIQDCQSMGLRQMTLNTYNSNISAIKLYQDMGFYILPSRYPIYVYEISKL